PGPARDRGRSREWITSGRVVRASCGLSLELFQGGEDAIGAGVNVDRGEIAPCDDAALVDDEQRAPAGTGLRIVCAIRARHGSLGFEVGQKGKAQLADFAVRLVAPGPTRM